MRNINWDLFKALLLFLYEGSERKREKDKLREEERKNEERIGIISAR